MENKQAIDDIPLAILVLAKQYCNTITRETYFSLTISVNYHHIHKSRPTPGQGNYYIYAAAKWLDEKGIISTTDSNLKQYCDDNGISLNTAIINVDNFDKL